MIHGLKTVKLAVQAVMSLDLPRVIVETDSLGVVDLLNATDLPSHRYVEHAQAILDLQREHGSLMFQHVPREGNCLADYLAKVSLNLQFGEHWFTSPFGECHSILSRDRPVDPGDPV